MTFLAFLLSTSVTKDLCAYLITRHLQLRHWMISLEHEGILSSARFSGLCSSWMTLDAETARGIDEMRERCARQYLDALAKGGTTPRAASSEPSSPSARTGEAEWH